MPATVRITDVSPRDGLQNEPGIIPPDHKAALVNRLRAARVDEVEVSSFVSPRWVPQLGDAAEVFSAIAPARPGDPMFSALVPNEQGLDAALGVNARAGARLISKVSVFTAASETFSKRNTNATIDQTLDRFRPVVARAHEAGLLVRGYVSCAVACPFEGLVPPAKVAGVASRLREMGVDELDLGDTIGVATPEAITALLYEVRGVWALDTNLTLHLHDTFGRAGECVRAALTMGVTSFDASAGGLGGCPYASTPGNRAPGNIATELLVRVIHQAGFRTNVDLDALAGAAAYARSLTSPREDGA